MSNEIAKPGQYLTFQLNQEQYGLPISAVREINRLAEITPVPKTPAFMKGVMNLRGKIIPVIDLRLKFCLTANTHTRDTCIIVIESNIGQVGMIVDSVREVADLKESQIEPAPALGTSESAKFIRGMGKIDQTVIILVDVVSALSKENLAEIPLSEVLHAA